MIVRHLIRSIVPLLWLVAAGSCTALAEVIFINADDLASTNVVRATNLEADQMLLHIAVVRFLPTSKSGKFSGEFPTNSTLASVISALGKQGQASLLYSGDRFVGGAAGVARFDSLERRPAFSLNASMNQTLTNQDFGLRLRAGIRKLPEGPTALTWEGSFSWSPDLLDAWAGEKYLIFGMRVAKVLKPGLVYYQSDDDDDAPAGINLRSLFSRKKDKTPPPSKPAPELSFLPADRKQLPLRGTQSLHTGDLAIFSATVGTDPKSPEFIYLLQYLSAAE